jgi:hypothetical protein
MLLMTGDVGMGGRLIEDEVVFCPLPPVSCYSSVG